MVAGGRMNEQTGKCKERGMNEWMEGEMDDGKQTQMEG